MYLLRPKAALNHFIWLFVPWNNLRKLERRQVSISASGDKYAGSKTYSSFYSRLNGVECEGENGPVESILVEVDEDAKKLGVTLDRGIRGRITL